MKIITTENVLQQLRTSEVIVQSYVYGSKHKKYWRISKPVPVKLSNDTLLVIPAGFVYDMATVPKWLWSLVRPFNDGLFGTLIHDYLYTRQMEHNLTRREADLEMLHWGKITNSSQFDNYLRYIFIRAFGWIWWYK